MGHYCGRKEEEGKKNAALPANISNQSTVTFNMQLKLSIQKRHHIRKCLAASMFIFYFAGLLVRNL
jgi:hypothetical protein